MMTPRRVVVTGMGVISPFGRGIDTLMNGLWTNQSAVQNLDGLTEIGGLRSQIACPVPPQRDAEIPRKARRYMSNMSIFACLAAVDALSAAGIAMDAYSDGRFGVAIGSTTGSTRASQDFFEIFLPERRLDELKSTHFFKIMNHSCAANVAQALGILGRVLAPAAACATASIAIGEGFEAVAHGVQDRMICGGADELHPLTTAVFDIMNAASSNFNDHPQQTPRPFDRRRDGVVCAEGSGILVLEALDLALDRGAPIFAEVIGFGMSSDPGNIAKPDPGRMMASIQEALAQAEIQPEDVDYVNAHATGTEHGDVAESQALAQLFGDRVAVSSLKGHLGHTMAACGAIELIAAVEMMNSGRLVATRNLEEPDPECCGIRHVHDGELAECKVIVKNSFALGGVNSTLILRKYSND